MNKKVFQSLAFAFIGLLVFASPAFTNAVQAGGEKEASLQSVVSVSGTISTDTTWTADNIYYITADTIVAPGVTLTIEGGTVVKFWVPLDPSISPRTELLVNGYLRFTGTSPENMVVFTSGRDDSAIYGGDTNGDGSQTLPAPGDWDYVRLTNWVEAEPSYQFMIVRYSYYGLNFHSTTTSVIPQPVFENNVLVDNYCGLTFSLESDLDLQGEVRTNDFSQNMFGFCTYRKSGTGQVNPTLSNNNFNNNSVLPIFLYGTSFPTYIDNTFTGFPDPGDRLGIGLGGEYNTSGTLTIVNDMPFVLVTPMEVIGSGTNLTVPAGAVFKSFTRYELAKSTDPLFGLKVTGGITFESTELEPIIFTSYRDDTVGGDTNGDDLDTEPYPTDWAGVHFVDSQLPSAANYTFEWLEFRYAVNGFLYETTTTSTGARRPIINHDIFRNNLNGLRFKAVSDSLTSRIEPTIQQSIFAGQGIIPTKITDTQPGVPIMLENVVEPTYVGNIFSGNLHPAIGLTGKWRGVVRLVNVAGQGLDPLPFLIHGDMWVGNANTSTGIENGPQLTIPSGAILKLFVNPYETDPAKRSRLLASSQLVMESTEFTPIVFTSYFDDAYGGDTDGGVSINPAPSDWTAVIVRHPDTEIHDAIFRYADKGLHVQNKVNGGSIPFDAAIRDSNFSFNNYGLYLDIQATNDITSLIDSNVFFQNSVGLGTFAKDTRTITPKVTGVVWATFRANHFDDNSLFPIYLNGSTTLEYFETSNWFTNNDHTAIALGGYWGAVKDPGLAFSMIIPQIYAGPTLPLSEQLLPYVVWNHTYFDWNSAATLSGGLVFKFDSAKQLHFYSKLVMNTTPAAKNVFTSYVDDTYLGDTNADGSATYPARGNWNGIYLYNRLTPSFNYSTVKYSAEGLVIFEKNATVGDLNIGIAYNRFESNTKGLKFIMASNNNITSRVEANTFYNNGYGIHVYTTQDTSYPNHCGLTEPTLVNNNFSLLSDYPIYLQGSSDPTYTDNMFWDNTHPAIGVGGFWCQTATWSKVYDDTFGQDMPYVVLQNITQENDLGYARIILPESLIVKFGAGTYIYAHGYLEMLSAPGTEIIFTSLKDDVYGGDIDANGTPASISRSDWKSVWLYDVPGKFNVIHDLKVFYATAGLTMYYYGPINTQATPVIEDVQFSECFSAINSVIGWVKINNVIYGGEGNINATIKNVSVAESDYGILTIAHDKSTGINNSSLENVTFSNITQYPLYLGGTTEFSYISGLAAVQDVDFMKTQTSLQSLEPESAVSFENVGGGSDLPGNQKMLDEIQPGTVSLQTTGTPYASITTALNYYPAIGMAGPWNNSVSLTQFDGIPYAVRGDFPMTITAGGATYSPPDTVTIGAFNAGGSILGVPAGTVFKFNSALSMIVNGTLNLQSTESQPVIFTSLKDDSAEGDTNRDGTLTRPAKGNWGELRLASTNAINYAYVRYATKGLHIYFNGPINQNNGSTVSHSNFVENTNGISISALDNGDVSSSITDSTFSQNTIHIIGYPSGVSKTGHLCVDAHNNDLFGTKDTQNGIQNDNMNGAQPVIATCVDSDMAFDATNNYWGDASGPYHATLNPAGLGSTVSDRVKFEPWLNAPLKPPVTYSISGRITKDSPEGDGLPGVTVYLQGAASATTTTDLQGYYSFSELHNGSYFVTPALQAYTFSPNQMNPAINDMDAENVNFVAFTSQSDVAFSVNSVKTFRPLTANPKTYCSFTVSIDKPLDYGVSAYVWWSIYAGTANGTTDYEWKPDAKVTFYGGQSLTQKVNIELKMTPLLDPEKYFFLVLRNPYNGYLKVSSGTCTIMTTNTVYIPLIKK